MMKKTYAILVAGALLISTGLYSCTGENTTGVDTETTNNAVDGRLNDPEEGIETEDNISPLDTADNVLEEEPLEEENDIEMMENQ